MTRADLIAAMRQLGLSVLASGYQSGLLDAEYALAHIEIYCWSRRDDEWRQQALPVIAALRDLLPAGVR